MTTPETASPREMVNVSIPDRIRLFYIAKRFRDVFSSDLLVDLDLFPLEENEEHCSVLYTSVFVESDARVVTPTGRLIDFKALIPIDVNKIETSADKPIAMPRQLNDETLRDEVRNFIAGGSSDLAAVNITHISSLQDEPTIVVVQNPSSETHRTLSMLRTNRVDGLVRDVFNGGRALGENIILDQELDTGKTVQIRMSNAVWNKGRVKRHGDSEVFIDPAYSINIPLYRDGKCFIVQFGLNKPPADITNVEYLTALKALRVFAQKELNRAWTEADKQIGALPTRDETKIFINIHDIRSEITKTQGFIELIITMLDNKELTPETKMLLIDFAKRAQNGVELEKQLLQDALDSAMDAEKIMFESALSSAQQAVDEWVVSSAGKESLERKNKRLSLEFRDNTINKKAKIICKSWMLSKLFIGAIDNGLKHVQDGGDLNMIINIDEIEVSDRKFLEVTIANNDGGAPDERVVELNNPDTQRVLSDTGTSGMFLSFVAREFRKLGKLYDYPIPIEFKNTELAGSKGFTIVFRVPVLENEPVN